MPSVLYEPSSAWQSTEKSSCAEATLSNIICSYTDKGRVQVEATKFTETGFHGRDVDQIIRDLVENALALTKQKLRESNQQQIEKAVEDIILKQLCGVEANERTIVCLLLKCNHFKQVLHSATHLCAGKSRSCLIRQQNSLTLTGDC